MGFPVSVSLQQLKATGCLRKSVFQQVPLLGIPHAFYFPNSERQTLILFGAKDHAPSYGCFWQRFRASPPPSWEPSKLAFSFQWTALAKLSTFALGTSRNCSAPTQRARALGGMELPATALRAFRCCLAFGLACGDVTGSIESTSCVFFLGGGLACLNDPTSPPCAPTPPSKGKRQKRHTVGCDGVEVRALKEDSCLACALNGKPQRTDKT